MELELARVDYLKVRFDRCTPACERVCRCIHIHMDIHEHRLDRLCDLGIAVMLGIVEQVGTTSPRTLSVLPSSATDSEKVSARPGKSQEGEGEISPHPTRTGRHRRPQWHPYLLQRRGRSPYGASFPPNCTFGLDVVLLSSGFFGLCHAS